tara:strand:- start:986 stop:1561 length:576 start_codon:yes stop_codon:yes gene_type:complete
MKKVEKELLNTKKELLKKKIELKKKIGSKSSLRKFDKYYTIRVIKITILVLNMIFLFLNLYVEHRDKIDIDTIYFEYKAIEKIKKHKKTLDSMHFLFTILSIFVCVFMINEFLKIKGKNRVTQDYIIIILSCAACLINIITSIFLNFFGDNEFVKYGNLVIKRFHLRNIGFLSTIVYYISYFVQFLIENVL